LIALNKKSGGIHPLLDAWYSSVPIFFGTSRLKDYFHPCQLGVGIPSGCEAAVHSARRYLETMPADHVMVKLDFANAFNSLHRYDMLLFIHA